MATTKKQPRPASLEAKTIEVINKIANLPQAVTLAKETLDKLVLESQQMAEDLSLGLKVAEAEMASKLEDLETTHATRVSTLEEAYKLAYSKLEEIRIAKQKEVNDLEVSIHRQIENLQYDLDKSKERNSLDAANEIAAKFGKVVVDEAELASNKATIVKLQEGNTLALEALKKEDEKEKAIALNSLKSMKDAEISLLTQQVTSLTSQLAKAERDAEYYKQELSKVPDQIAKAVQAASQAINVNNDLTGRK